MLEGTGLQPEVLEHRVHDATVAPFVLRHRGAGDPGFHGRGPKEPIGVADTQQALVVGQGQEKIAQMVPDIRGEVRGGRESGALVHGFSSLTA